MKQKGKHMCNLSYYPQIEYAPNLAELPAFTKLLSQGSLDERIPFRESNAAWHADCN